MTTMTGCLRLLFYMTVVLSSCMADPDPKIHVNQDMFIAAKPYDPWGDTTMLNVVLKFPKSLRVDRSLGLHDRMIEQVKTATGMLMEELLKHLRSVRSVEEPEIYESEDEFPVAVIAINYPKYTDASKIQAFVLKQAKKAAEKIEQPGIIINVPLDGRITQPCKTPSDCVPRGSTCNEERRCQCKERFIHTGTSCKPDGLLGSECQKLEECSPEHTRCFENLCTCDHDYHVDKGVCVPDPLLGKSCTGVAMCHMETMNCVEGICVCKSGHIEHKQHCYIQRNHEETCKIDRQCPDNSHCDKKCTCSLGYGFVVGSGCVEAQPLGSVCGSDGECLGSGTLCEDGKCACEEGLAPSKNHSSVCISATVVVTYEVPLQQPYDANLYGDPQSPESQAKIQLVTGIVEGAGIPGFVAVNEVELTASEDNLLIAVVTFSVDNPDAVISNE